MQIKEIMTGEPVVVGPEEQRQEWTLSDRLQDFIDMKDDAEIVEGRANAVDIGCQVTVRDTGTGEQRTFVVGSYQVARERDLVRRPARQAAHGCQRRRRAGGCDRR